MIQNIDGGCVGERCEAGDSHWLDIDRYGDKIGEKDCRRGHLNLTCIHGAGYLAEEG